MVPFSPSKQGCCDLIRSSICPRQIQRLVCWLADVLSAVLEVDCPSWSSNPQWLVAQQLRALTKCHLEVVAAFRRSVMEVWVGSGGEANKQLQLLIFHFSAEMVRVALQLIEPFWCGVKLGRIEYTLPHVDKGNGAFEGVSCTCSETYLKNCLRAFVFTETAELRSQQARKELRYYLSRWGPMLE